MMIIDPEKVNGLKPEGQGGENLTGTPTPGVKPEEKPEAVKPKTAGQKIKPPETGPVAPELAQGNSAKTGAELKEMQQRLAELEAQLAEERQKNNEVLKLMQAQARPKVAEGSKTPQPVPGAQAQQPGEDQLSDMVRPFGLLPLVNFQPADFFKVSQQLTQQAIKQPPLFLKHSTNFLLELGKVMTGQSKVEPAANDKRFTDEAWKKNPFYHTYLQSYLAWQQSLNGFINEAELDKKDADRARYIFSLYADAVAPTNTLLGNPAALKKLNETGGVSLVSGLTHLLEDLTKNGGMPSQVDMKAFQVGKDLATTPGVVVFKNEVLELIQYQPTTPQVYSRPLLMVPPQVNKYYATDLTPNKSLIRYLVASGQQVFTISWRNPTPKQRDWGFDSYVQAVLEAIDAVRAITGSKDVNMTGACLGGMTLASLLGYLAARGDKRVHAVTFLVTVLDSNVDTTMGLFATKETIAAAKQASRLKGVLEGQEMARMFAWLRPNDLVWNYWVNNYLLGNDPAAFDVLFWNNDTTRLPARLHGELLDLMEDNTFTRPGKFKVLDTPIDLAKVKCDAYILAGRTDHITPWQGCYATTRMLGGKVRFILSNSGHIQALLNPPGNPKASYFVSENYPADPQEWQDKASQQPGSWWEDWREWLGQRSGEKKAAPQELGNEQYQPGTPAPGSYVFEP